MNTKRVWKILIAALAALLVLACAVGFAACGDDTSAELEETKAELERTQEKLEEAEAKLLELEESSTQSTSGDLSYAIYYDGSGYMVTGIGDWTDPNLVIPAEHNGLPVVAIGDCAFSSNYPRYGYDGYTFLKSLTIPDTVKFIGAGAFAECTGIETVTLGSGVERVERYAFSNLESLENVYISDIGAWCKISWRSGNIVSSNSDAELYLNGELVENVVIPEGVTSIEANAFESVGSLKSVVIADSVTYIGEDAFENCENLEYVDMRGYVAKMSNGVFANCYSLENIVMPKTVTYIDQNTFARCYSLSHVFYGGTPTEWDNVEIEEWGNDYLTDDVVYFYSETEPDYMDGFNWWHYVDGVATVWG